MNNLAESFISAENIWIGVLILLTPYLLKTDLIKVFSFFIDKKYKETNQIKSLLESDLIGSEMTLLLKEHLRKSIFKKYYGINANQDMRHRLYEFQAKNSKKINWDDLSKAYRYVQKDGESLKIVFTRLDKIERWYVRLVSYLIGLLGLLLISRLFLNLLFEDSSTEQIVTISLLSLGLIFVAMLFNMLNLPFKSAMKIRNCMDDKVSNNKKVEVKI